LIRKIAILPCPRKQENAFLGVSCSKNFWGTCPQTPLDAQALSGLQNVAMGHVFHCYG